MTNIEAHKGKISDATISNTHLYFTRLWTQVSIINSIPWEHPVDKLELRTCSPDPVDRRIQWSPHSSAECSQCCQCNQCVARWCPPTYNLPERFHNNIRVTLWQEVFKCNRPCERDILVFVMKSISGTLANKDTKEPIATKNINHQTFMHLIHLTTFMMLILIILFM